MRKVKQSFAKLVKKPGHSSTAVILPHPSSGVGQSQGAPSSRPESPESTSPSAVVTSKADDDTLYAPSAYSHALGAKGAVNVENHGADKITQNASADQVAASLSYWQEQQGVSGLEKQAINTMQTAALDKLRHVPNAVYDAQLRGGCMENTRVAVLADAIKWSEDASSKPIFWLSGMAGTGKTSIAWTLCDMLDAKDILGGSFFCSRTSSVEQGDVTRIIPTLVRLFALRHDAFRSALVDKLEQDPDVSLKRIDRQIEQLLLRPLLATSVSTRPVIFIIDALDECSNKDATVEMLATLTAHTASFPTYVKFFVTSRPERHIRGTSLSDVNLNRILRLHEIEPSIVDSDIRLYLRTRLSERQTMPPAPSSGLPSPWFSDQDLDALVRLTNGLFIFASTAIAYIRGRDSAGRLRKLLNRVKPGKLLTQPLDSMYELIIEDTSSTDVLESDELESLKHLLAQILAMRTPLSVCTFGELLGVSSLQLRTTFDLLHAVIYVPDDDITPGLKTLHASFGDFLVSRAAPHILINVSIGHDDFSRGCLSRFRGEDLCFNVSKSPSSYIPNPDPKLHPSLIPAALEYACLHWAYHVAGASQSLTFESLIEKVVVPKFLFWLEVLSVLGRIGEAAGLILAAKSQVTSPDLSHFLRDANEFVTSSREAIEFSAPHIYMSALPSAPNDSLISQYFSSNFEHLPSIQTHGLTRDPAALLVLKGHENLITSLDFSPDGKRLATASYDHTIRVWNAATGEEVLTLLGHSGEVYSVAFNADGTRLASGSRDATIRIWNPDTGEEVLSPLRGHVGSITCVAYSPDGALIVSGSEDKTIRLWDALTGAELLPRLDGHQDSVTSVSFSYDGLNVLSSAKDATVRVWDSRSGTELRSLSPGGGTAEVTSAAYSREAELIVSASFGKVASSDVIRIWDARSGAEISWEVESNVENTYAYSVAFAPVGQHVVGVIDGAAHLLDVLTGREISQIQPPEGTRFRVALMSPDGERMALGSTDGTISLWATQAAAKREISSFKSPTDRINTIKFLSDGVHLLLGSLDGHTSLWDASSGSQAFISHQYKKPVSCVAGSPDGSHVAFGAMDGTVHILDASTGMEVRRPLAGHQKRVTSVVFSPDGERLLSTSLDNTIRTWDVHTGAEVGILKAHAVEIGAVVTFSHDSSRIVFGSSDMTIRILDTSTGSEAAPPFIGHEGRITSVTFSPNGQLIASGSRDNTVRLWDCSSGTNRAILREEEYRIDFVSFSPDGDCVVSCSLTDEEIRLWDVQTGAKLLLRANEPVTAIAFSHDAKYMATAHVNQTIAIWDANLCTKPSEAAGSAVVDLRCLSLDANKAWIVGPLGELVFWVPPEYRQWIQTLPCVLLIGSHRIIVDYTDCRNAHGTNWTLCYRG